MLSGFLEGLLVELVKTGVSGLGRKLVELNAIHNAFQAASIREPGASTEADKGELPEPIARSLRSIEIVLGSHEGILTQDLSDFLKKLYSSPLIVLMAEAALFKLPTDESGCQAAFSSLFETHFQSPRFEAEGQSFDAAELYRAIRLMLGASLRYQSSEGSKLFISEVRQKEQLEAIIAADAQLKEIYAPDAIEAGSPFQSPNAKADAAAFCRGLAGQLLPSVSYLFVEGPERRGARQVRLNDLYVPTDLVPSQTHKHFTDSPFSDTPIKPSDLLERHKRVVVRGDPGGGKSTLAQKLCFDALVACVRDGRQLGIRLEIRRYASSLAHTPQLSLLNFLVAEIEQATSRANLAGWIGYLLRSGRAIVAFDGLDEVLVSDEKRRIANYISGFSEAFPFCPIVVTARRVGYFQAPLPHSLWHHLELGEFGPTEITDYVGRATRAMFSESREDIERSQAYFATGLSVEARDLVRNPLLLALMVWLFHERRGEVPDNRAEIYRQCSLLMFERWDRGRRILPDIPDDFDLLDLLSHLSAKIFTEKDYASGIDGVTLTNEIVEFFKNIYSSDASGRARRSAERVVEFVTGRAWVMTDMGNDVYDFTHRTFLEYFFGRYLNDKYETISQLLEEIVPKILKGDWAVPSHLAIQMKTSGRPSSAQTVIKNLLGRAKEIHSGNTDEFLTFLLQTTRYLPAGEAEVEEVGYRAMLRAIQLPSWERHIRAAINRVVPRRRALYRGLARAALQISGSDTVTSLRMNEWLYQFKTARARGSEVPDDVDEFFSVFDTFLAENPGSQESKAIKFVFNVSGRTLDQAQHYGIDLWKVQNPVEQRNWLQFDLYQMVVEFISCLVEDKMEELPAYANLGAQVMRNFAESAPMAIPQGDVVAPAEIATIDWSAFQHLPNTRAGAAAGIAALSFIELAETSTAGLRPMMSPSMAAQIRRSIIGKFPTDHGDRVISAFVHNYRRNAVRLFK